MHVVVVAALALLAVGLSLASISYFGSNDRVVERMGNDLVAGTWRGSSVELGKGFYEVCIEDKDPGIRDYGSFVFEIESLDATVPVKRSDGLVVRELDGIRYEVVCSFTIPRSDSYFYDTSINGNSLNGTWVEMVIIREATYLDQPTFLGGVGLVVASLVALPLAVQLLRRPAHRPEV